MPVEKASPLPWFDGSGTPRYRARRQVCDLHRKLSTQPSSFTSSLLLTVT